MPSLNTEKPMKNIVRNGQIEPRQPFDLPPEDLQFYVRDRWLAQLNDQVSVRPPLDDRLISFLESEAIAALAEIFPQLPAKPVRDTIRPKLGKRAVASAKFSAQAQPAGVDTFETATERWRRMWVVEAFHHERHAHTYPKKIEAAMNILIAASRLRSAIDAGDSQRAAALGMLLALEVIGGGYGLEIETKLEAHEVVAKAKKRQFNNTIGKTHEDLEKARLSCIEKAQAMWLATPTLRIGQVAESCREAMLMHRDKFPTLKTQDIPEIEAIKTWFREAAGRGGLKMPPDAQKPGRPRKTAGK